MGAESDRKSRSPWLAIATNLIATVLLAILIGLGIYVNVKRLVVGTIHTSGYSVVDLDTTSWNVGCTIVGTAVGLLSAVAFAVQDDYLTRRELVCDSGVAALFLRPLTIKRGAEQVFHRQLPFERTLLVLLTVVTALSSAAVVGLFGIRATVDTIVNPAGSYPLASLNSSFFESDGNGAVFPAGSPATTPQTSRLSGFVYKAAYITGLKMNGDYVPLAISDTPYIPEQGTLGDTLYAELNTQGIGLNVSSYLQFSGMPNGFDMPARYEFDTLHARVFGTRVAVSCRNASSQYTEVDADIAGISADIYVKTIARNTGTGPNITVTNDLSGDRILRGLVLASAVTLDSGTGVPTQTIAIPAFLDAFGPTLVLECTYTGREFLADVVVDSAVSPVRVIQDVGPAGPLIGPLVVQRLANVTNRLIGADGGNLARGFVDSKYNADGFNNTDVARAVETVLGMLSEAYISLMRQQIERSNLYRGGSSAGGDAGDAEVRLYATVLRLGGGGNVAWVVVLALMMTGALWGTVRTCRAKGVGVALEPQDAVQLLRSALQDPGIEDRARLRWRDGLLMRERGEGYNGESHIS